MSDRQPRDRERGHGDWRLPAVLCGAFAAFTLVHHVPTGNYGGLVCVGTFALAWAIQGVLRRGRIGAARSESDHSSLLELKLGSAPSGDSERLEP